MIEAFFRWSAQTFDTLGPFESLGEQEENGRKEDKRGMNYRETKAQVVSHASLTICLGGFGTESAKHVHRNLIPGR
jgi:hypothetical protein